MQAEAQGRCKTTPSLPHPLSLSPEDTSFGAGGPHLWSASFCAWPRSSLRPALYVPLGLLLPLVAGSAPVSGFQPVAPAGSSWEWGPAGSLSGAFSPDEREGRKEGRKPFLGAAPVIPAQDQPSFPCPCFSPDTLLLSLLSAPVLCATLYGPHLFKDSSVLLT